MTAAPDSSSSELRPDRPTGPWHEALAYSSPDRLAVQLAERVDAAVAAGDPVTAVLDEAVEQRLRDELGRAAAGVEFQLPGTVHTVPGFTTAVRWARRGRRADDPDGRALVVGQQLLELPGCGGEYWMRLCLGLEVTGAGLPLTVLCAFRDETAGWARVRETHPVLGTANGSETNPLYRPPLDVVLEHPPSPRPVLEPPAAELSFRATDLGRLRHLTSKVAARGGLGPDRIADAVLAVNELATNSIEHGPGSGRLRLWDNNQRDDNQRDGKPRGMLAEVSDRGRLTDPFPGMSPPATSGPSGRGLWLICELSDVMEVWTDDGTVVRVSWLG